MGSDETDRSAQGSVAASVSTRLVQLVAEYCGRGPSKARTVVGSDYILVLFAETLTRWEHRLIATGHREQVLALRRALYDAMRPEAVSAVRDLVGRDVTCFLADSETDPDVSVAVFVLGAGDQLQAGADDD